MNTGMTYHLERSIDLENSFYYKEVGVEDKSMEKATVENNQEVENKPKKRGRPKKSPDSPPERRIPTYLTVMKSQEQCKICKSGLAKRVDTMLLLGYTQSEVVREINEEMGYEFLNYMNIHRHIKHMDSQAKVVLLLKKKRKHEEKTIDFLLGEANSLLWSFLDLASAEIFKGEYPVRVYTKDLIDKWLRAIELLLKSAEIEGEIKGNEVLLKYQSLVRAFEVFGDIVRKVCTREQRAIIEREYAKCQDYIEGLTHDKPKINPEKSPEAIEGECEEER